MSEQASISFEPHTLHRKDDPITSHLAAESIRGLRETHFRVILEALRSNGPMTSEDISDWTGLDYHAVARRMGALRDSGRVIQDQTKRRNRSGCEAFVWSIVS